MVFICGLFSGLVLGRVGSKLATKAVDVIRARWYPRRVERHCQTVLGYDAVRGHHASIEGEADRRLLPSRARSAGIRTEAAPAGQSVEGSVRGDGGHGPHRAEVTTRTGGPQIADVPRGIAVAWWEGRTSFPFFVPAARGRGVLAVRRRQCVVERGVCHGLAAGHVQRWPSGRRARKIGVARAQENGVFCRHGASGEELGLAEHSDATGASEDFLQPPLFVFTGMPEKSGGPTNGVAQALKREAGARSTRPQVPGPAPEPDEVRGRRLRARGSRRDGGDRC